MNPPNRALIIRGVRWRQDGKGSGTGSPVDRTASIIFDGTEACLHSQTLRDRNTGPSCLDLEKSAGCDQVPKCPSIQLKFALNFILEISSCKGFFLVRKLM